MNRFPVYTHLTTLHFGVLFLVAVILNGAEGQAETRLLRVAGQSRTEDRRRHSSGAAESGTERKKATSDLAELKEKLRRAPASFEANHNLGEFYVRRGDLARAIPLLEKAQQIDPSHYINGYDLALAYLQTGNLSQARRQAQEMLKRKETAELHNLLGEVEERAGDLVRAAEEYHRAARMDESEQNLLDLGNILVKLTAYEEAIKIYDYAVGRYPRSSALRVGLGVAQYSRGQYEEAVKTLCAAADLDPRDPRPYLFLGEMYGVSVEMSDEVRKRMARFVETHPRNALAHYYYAMNLWKGRRDPAHPADLKQVETLLNTAVRLDPKLARAHLELGQLYAEQQRHAEAIEELKKAVSLQPDLAQAHYRLGLLYQRAGQKTLAAQEMEIYKRLNERAAKPAGP